MKAFPEWERHKRHIGRSVAGLNSTSVPGKPTSHLTKGAISGQIESSVFPTGTLLIRNLALTTDRLADTNHQLNEYGELLRYTCTLIPVVTEKSRAGVRTPYVLGLTPRAASSIRYSS